jgi:hypothetical protein
MRIRRSWSWTLSGCVLTAASGAVAFYAHRLASSASGLLWLVAWVIVVAAAVFALTCAWVVVRESGQAPCPHCRSRLEGLDAHVASLVVRCETCEGYAVCRRGEVHRVPNEFVDEAPIFEAPLPRQIHWPAGCCVCGAAVGRFLPVEYLRRPLAFRGKVKTVEVPHCDAHEAGAALKVGNGHPRPLTIAFRSYAYQRAFRDLNFGPRL